MTKHTSGELSTVLAKLAQDDAFRAQMLANPVNALAKLGIKLDPAQVPAERSLPSKESIAADQADLYNSLVGEASMIIFLLSGVEVAA